MDYQEKSALPLIESVYKQLTHVERTIADFFLQNRTEQDFSARTIANRLKVSEASLSRFAKKCGFRGYREFIYIYESGFHTTSEEVKVTESSRTVLSSYQELLNKTWSLIDEEQIARIVHLITAANRVFTAGKGSSGFAAEEMAFRIMRIGVDATAITDNSIMEMQSIMARPGNLCIALSLSGESHHVVNFLKGSHARGASTILITASYSEALHAFCDEIVLVPSLQYMNNGSLISPQFPFLVIIDVLYAGFLKLDRSAKEELLSRTVDALQNV